MRRIIYISISFFILVWIGSCTEPVVDLPETKEKLIVQSEFDDEGQVRIYFFKGVNMPIEGIEPNIPDSLELRLSYYGEDLTVSRVEDVIPYYSFDQRDWLPGEELSLRAQIFGETQIDAVRASTSFPRADSLTGLNAQISIIEETEESRLVELQLTFDISNSNFERFYELVVLQEAAGTLMPPVDTMWQEVGPDWIFPKAIEHELPAGIHWIRTRNSYLIDHFKLSDKHIAMSLRMEVDKNSDLSMIRLNLKSHTEDGFEFIKSYDKWQHDYYAEFPILISNIDDGIGVFTAFVQKDKLIYLSNR